MLKAMIKDRNSLEKDNKRKYNKVYKKAVNYVNSLSEQEVRHELILEIISRDYYSKYNFDREEEFKVLDDIDEDIIEMLENEISLPKPSEFIYAFEMIDDEDTWIDIRTCEVYHRYYFECEDMDEDAIDEFLNDDSIIALPSRYDLNVYNDMIAFIDIIEDKEIQNKLYKSVNGKGAFRRFENDITYYDLREQWFDFKDNRLKEKVIDWLKVNNIDFVNNYDD